MLKTTFLSNQDYNYKEFHSGNVIELTGKYFNVGLKRKILSDVLSKTFSIQPFYTSKGDTVLKHLDFIYCLENMPYNADIVLPKNPKPGSWIILHYEQQTVCVDLSMDKYTKFKLKGNGERIMGYDEDLMCDIPFISLRLTYLDKINGWLVT